MQNVVNSLAVLAFVGVVILLFASSALLRMVRDLKAGLLEAQTGHGLRASARPVRQLAAGDGRRTFVLVAEEHCTACRARAEHLREVSAGVDGHLVLLSADAGCASWTAGGPVRPLIDAELVGQLGIGVTPSLLEFSPDGLERSRRLAGSDHDLEQFLGLSSMATTAN